MRDLKQFRILATLAFSLLTLTSLTLLASAQTNPSAILHKNDFFEQDLRSDAKIMADTLAATGGIMKPDEGPGGGQEQSSAPDHRRRGNGNVLVSDPTQDLIQQFFGFRPFVHATQSETSIALRGSHVVATYNNSAGIHLTLDPTGTFVFFDRLQIGGYSTSTDGGRTFNAAFFPGVGGTPFTFGDPSIDVDRGGNFYFAQLSQDADGVHGVIQINKSTDGGLTWTKGIVAAVDDGSDKEWIAVGRDPFKKKRDNVYVTWTSFQNTGSEVHFAKSIDGGNTWTSKTVFAPGPDLDPTHPQNFIQFTNPVVDPSDGTLYVPFAHFSNADTDFLQMLVSHDAGKTFTFATFNMPGAPDNTLLPLVQPGHFTDCGSPGGDFRLVVHQGPDLGGGRLGLSRFMQSSRLTVQPSIAARDGRVYMAWNTSTSPFFGDPASNSNIMFTRSNDGGQTWTAPIVVNSSADPNHVLPSLVLDENSDSVHIAYYTQHANGRFDVDMANSQDRGNTFGHILRVTSTSFDLPPTNIPVPTAKLPFRTQNFDRNIQPCYALGEYLNVRNADGKLYVLWGDSRNSITEPVDPLDPISGQTHPKEDVFLQVVKADGDGNGNNH